MHMTVGEAALPRDLSRAFVLQMIEQSREDDRLERNLYVGR
jgi:hypothetical protein